MRGCSAEDRGPSNGTDCGARAAVGGTIFPVPPHPARRAAVVTIAPATRKRRAAYSGVFEFVRKFGLLWYPYQATKVASDCVPTFIARILPPCQGERGESRPLTLPPRDGVRAAIAGFSPCIDRRFRKSMHNGEMAVMASRVENRTLRSPLCSEEREIHHSRIGRRTALQLHNQGLEDDDQRRFIVPILRDLPDLCHHHAQLRHCNDRRHKCKDTRRKHDVRFVGQAWIVRFNLRMNRTRE